MTTVVSRRGCSEPLIPAPVHAPDTMSTAAASASALHIEDKVDPLAAQFEGALDPATRRIVPEQTAVIGRQDPEALGHDALLAGKHERVRAARVDDKANLPTVLRVDQALPVDEPSVPEAVRRQQPGADHEWAARANNPK